MNPEVPNIRVVGGSEGTKDQADTANYHCTELLGGKNPEDGCPGYLRSWWLGFCIIEV